MKLETHIGLAKALATAQIVTLLISWVVAYITLDNNYYFIAAGIWSATTITEHFVRKSLKEKL